MELKAYQQQALDTLRRYLTELRKAEAKREQLASLALDIPYEWDRDAWQQTVGHRHYHPRQNGIGDSVPNVCFKVPTGGGKTFLAVKSIDVIMGLYRKQQTGLVLWIVPTTQIYQQTLRYLRDRTHPYRQSLDLTSGNRTLILEKDERFSPVDVQDQLVILLLMLPSANRQNKETLRLFQDQGGFEPFFPPEDDWQAQEALHHQIPNLDLYESQGALFGGIIKSSLGNTLRLLNPLIILDEGHKAYSSMAQATLAGFNPFFILELSATPDTAQSNILVNITGRAVHQEGMLKLDIHLHRQASNDWRDTTRASHEHRLALEKLADRYQAETGHYIRPINLIQVERTGKTQRGAGLIHAEDVREFLIEKCAVLPEEIAVKSSERDEIEQIDLLASDCPIRYIITKQALQEGWDCPFAYILTVLTNPEARTAMTQLVGRVLRQPYAHKTGWIELDESYVYCYRVGAIDLVQQIRAGLEEEGLGDVAGRVTLEREVASSRESHETPIRPQFQQYAGKVYLPCFVVPDGAGGWREIEYEIDILSRVDWSRIDLSHFDTLQLNLSDRQDTHTRIGFDEPLTMLQTTTASETEVDLVWMTRHLLKGQGVPNPWYAYEFVKDVLVRLRQRYSDAEIKRDLGFVIEELNKTLIEQRRTLAKEVFLRLIQDGSLRFYLLAGCAGSAIPDRVRVTGYRKLTTNQGDPIQHSLFDVMEDDFNQLEKAVALYLEQQYWVLAWYRNAVKFNYRIQGWQEHKVYSDFIVLGHDAPQIDEPLPEPSQVPVLETKGLHLNNEDTSYKQELFKLCEDMSQPTPIDALTQEFSNHEVRFQVVFEDEWERVLNALLQPARE